MQGFDVGGVDFSPDRFRKQRFWRGVKTHLQLRDTQLHLEELVEERTAELEKLLAERSAALDSAEQQIRTLFQNAQLGIGLTSPEGEILSVNRALLDMTGYTEKELLHRNVIDLYLEPEQRSELVARLLSSGAVRNFGAKILRKDGTFLYAGMNVSKLTREGREVLLALVEDVTERVEAQKLLEQSAARAERDRLAQDLHDSVSQGLYSAGLIAETLPAIWEEDPEEGRRGLRQLERLTQGASAEMRALLLELRPSALVDQELPFLLRQLAIATMARTQTVVTMTVVGNCETPDEVKIALYRIAQEALNNVVKHAQARQARGNLQCHEARDGPKLSLRIDDNGIGFDTEAKPSQGLGQRTMRERAEGISATLTITSQPGQGTEVLAEWSAS